MSKGGFTLPGQTGYEELTLKLAKKWGADVIRDSDGTKLSDDILNAGYKIYSTICIVREHNEWARQHLDKLQQTFLCTPPALSTSENATSVALEISLMESFFSDQFRVNDTASSLAYWQVYDRTTDTLLDPSAWEYNKEHQTVTIHQPTPWHRYTVSFIAYRIWEEISMYNHTTNNWDTEHLMQIDPRYPENQAYLLKWLRDWCENNPDTDVVRFTSLFYNFVWIWGSDERNRHKFVDWASYDYTVSVLALEEFEKAYGYRLVAEDFVNQGKLQVTHMPPSQKKLDYMTFINDFVISFGKQLIDIVHEYGKKAYVFYDDNWVGMEPYNGRFHEFGFDGMIKCVFSGYEARMCSAVAAPIHEIRLHPYLFPVGLGGLPTFMEGGNPTLDAKKYWNNVRRALLRAKIDRIGLGGYLSLAEPYPDFLDYIEKVADESRLIRSFHDSGKPYEIKTKVAVLTCWGKTRTWTLSGHFHETYMHDLIHVIEALSGLPIDVSFISFEDVKAGRLPEFDVVINAGYAGSAWSGGDVWKDEQIVSLLTEWTHKGGAFIGVNQPSAVEGFDSYFRMSHVLGVDQDTGAKVCHGRWKFDVEDSAGVLPEGVALKAKEKRFLTDGKAKVLLANEENPILTINDFGQGKGIYLAEFDFNLANTRLLYQLIRYAGGEGIVGKYMTDNLNTECAYYPESRKLVVINNSNQTQRTKVDTEFGVKEFTIEPFDTVFVDL